jgi:CHAD domain-containing protein
VSERGELITFNSPSEGARAALAGAFTVRVLSDLDLDVRDGLDKLVCRIGLVVSPGNGWWLSLRPLRGYEADADEIHRMLLASASFITAEEWGSVKVPMSPGERSDVVTARVLRRLMAIQDANCPGALADVDIEYLHDFRVAVRRTRSVLREMRGVFRPADIERVRVSFKWLQDQTSATRDLDVYLDEFDVLSGLAPESLRADLEPLRELLRARQRHARAKMEVAVASDHARMLHADMTEILEVLVLEDEAVRPDASRPVGDLIGHRVRKVHHRMVQMGRTIGPDTAPEQYHELRKRGKELRYLLELFAAQLFDADVVKPMVKTLKGLQDVLGLHQDREVQIELLREMSRDLVAEPGGVDALMAIGVLIERLEDDAAAARERFADSFAEFASDIQCKLVKEAFS